jgi:hypothetical protein
MTSNKRIEGQRHQAVTRSTAETDKTKTSKKLPKKNIVHATATPAQHDQLKAAGKKLAAMHPPSRRGGNPLLTGGPEGLGKKGIHRAPKMEFPETVPLPNAATSVASDVTFLIDGMPTSFNKLMRSITDVAKYGKQSVDLRYQETVELVIAAEGENSNLLKQLRACYEEALKIVAQRELDFKNW